MEKMDKKKIVDKIGKKTKNQFGKMSKNKKMDKN